MNNKYLGIDLGTSSLKMVLTDSQKHILGQISEDYQVIQSQQGWCEIDPDIWFQAMKRGMKRILEGQDRKAIKGIGVTGQMHTLILIGEDGTPVRPAMMWNDTRTKDILPELKEKIKSFSEGDYLSKTISTGSPAANLYWLKLFEPETLKKVKKFLIGPDYLVYRMTGKQTTDYCEASTSCLYEICNKRWSQQMRQLIGLDAECYPDIHGSAESAGTLLAEIADEFGIGKDITVIVGTGDNPATAISTGCLGLGYPVISLGTSGVLMMPIEQPDRQTKGKKILCSFDGRHFQYLVQGVIQCNGNTFDWWNKTIMECRRFKEWTTAIDVSKNAKNDLIFYPHLDGDKTIYADPELRGAFVGLSLATSQENMFYAVIEGLCFGFRELAEKMHLPLEKFGTVKVVGGGARSPVWLQTMANVLNIPVEKMEGMIGPAFGIALLAAYQGGSISSLEQISEGNVKIECRYEPNTEAAAACEKKYQEYLRMRAGLRYIRYGTIESDSKCKN